jgi:hypothetical protein
MNAFERVDPFIGEQSQRQFDLLFFVFRSAVAEAFRSVAVDRVGGPELVATSVV